MDQYCLLLLVFFFSPIVDSLRGIQQASHLQKVQKRLGCPCASLGSLSEVTDVFDPERLQEIFEELGGRVMSLGKDPSLKDVRQLLTAVDGTVIRNLGHQRGRIANKSCCSRPVWVTKIHSVGHVQNLWLQDRSVRTQGQIQVEGNSPAALAIYERHEFLFRPDREITYFDDANLDGEFNPRDSVKVLRAGNYETQGYAGRYGSSTRSSAHSGRCHYAICEFKLPIGRGTGRRRDRYG